MSATLYATPEDLRGRYPAQDLRDLTDDPGAVIDDVALARALGDASAEIDAYLQARYTLPLASPPPILTRIACELAFYHLLTNRPAAALEDAQTRYERWLRYLEQVAKGVVALGPRADDTSAPAHDPVLSTGADRLFTRDALRGL